MFLITWYRRWQARRTADREAMRQTERILRAFTEGDQEVMRAEMARRYGLFFALFAQQLEHERRDREIERERDQ